MVGILLGERNETMRKRDDHLIVTYVPKVFVESLDSAFENVCELDLVFHFDEVRCSMFTVAWEYVLTTPVSPKAHHILAEIIQGGLVLETNVSEIDRAGEPPPMYPRMRTVLNARSRPPILTCSPRSCESTQGVVRVRQPALAWRGRSCRVTQRRPADTPWMACGKAHGSRSKVATYGVPWISYA